MNCKRKERGGGVRGSDFQLIKKKKQEVLGAIFFLAASSSGVLARVSVPFFSFSFCFCSFLSSFISSPFFLRVRGAYLRRTPVVFECTCFEEHAVYMEGLAVWPRFLL